MAYQALYREYRPRLFTEVMGQEHITRVLKNQVKTGHISHAYLFCGSRGTGKTTTAKILARAVNCLDPKDGDPCFECEACRSEAALNVDIVEMDAASNTGVDDIRAILEKTRFTPMILKRKVYIIDEVHMLSGSAFNALLKTLEEPPPHILFILATTEPQKLPATIISRCQRFDFRRLSVDCIVACLEGVLKSAGASADRDALAVIARYAAGGMRDALSLADQCISFVGNSITAADVYSVLGSAGEEALFNVADRLIDGDAAGALAMINSVVTDGRDLNVFMQDVTAHFRCLLLANTCGECADMLDCTKDTMARYIAQASRISVRRILAAMDVLFDAQGVMRWLPYPRPAMENAFVRVCHPEDGPDLDGLFARVETLEKRPSVPAVAAAAAAVPVSAVFRDDEPYAPPSDMPPEDMSDAPPFDFEEPTPPAPPIQAPPKPIAKQKPQTSASNVPSAAWDAILEGVKRRNRAAYGMLIKVERIRIEDNALLADFDRKLAYDFFLRGDNQLLVEDEVQKALPSLSFKPVLIADGGLTEDTARRLFGDALTVIE